MSVLPFRHPFRQHQHWRSLAVIIVLILVLVGGSLGVFRAVKGNWLGNSSGKQLPLSPLETSGLVTPATQAHASATTQAIIGTRWHIHNPGLARGLEGVVWSGSEFVAVGDTILTSPDGRAWTVQNPSSAYGLNGVTWSGSEFVAVGAGGILLTSP